MPYIIVRLCGSQCASSWNIKYQYQPYTAVMTHINSIVTVQGDLSENLRRDLQLIEPSCDICRSTVDHIQCHNRHKINVCDLTLTDALNVLERHGWKLMTTSSEQCNGVVWTMHK